MKHPTFCSWMAANLTMGFAAYIAIDAIVGISGNTQAMAVGAVLGLLTGIARIVERHCA